MSIFFSSFIVNKVQRSITLAAKFQCLKAFIIDLNQSGSRPKINKFNFSIQKIFTGKSFKPC